MVHTLKNKVGKVVKFQTHRNHTVTITMNVKPARELWRRISRAGYMLYKGK